MVTIAANASIAAPITRTTTPALPTARPGATPRTRAIRTLLPIISNFFVPAVASKIPHAGRPIRRKVIASELFHDSDPFVAATIRATRATLPFPSFRARSTFPPLSTSATFIAAIRAGTNPLGRPVVPGTRPLLDLLTIADACPEDFKPGDLPEDVVIRGGIGAGPRPSDRDTVDIVFCVIFATNVGALLAVAF